MGGGSPSRGRLALFALFRVGAPRSRRRHAERGPCRRLADLGGSGGTRLWPSAGSGPQAIQRLVVQSVHDALGAEIESQIAEFAEEDFPLSLKSDQWTLYHTTWLKHVPTSCHPFRASCPVPGGLASCESLPPLEAFQNLAAGR